MTKRFFCLLSVSLCVGLLIFFGFQFLGPADSFPKMGSVYDTKRFEGDRFSIQVHAFKEVTDGWALPGGVFIVEGKSEEWTSPRKMDTPKGKGSME